MKIAADALDVRKPMPPFRASETQISPFRASETQIQPSRSSETQIQPSRSRETPIQPLNPDETKSTTSEHSSGHSSAHISAHSSGHYADVRLPDSLLRGSAASEIIQNSLEEPLADFHARPSKKFRSLLVEAGYLLATDRSTPEQIRVCHALGEALEAIHAGSLIIDDIQDQSAERRGSATLHKKFGLPLALNAGNWLYFKSFELIRDLVRQHQISSQTELRLYRLCHQVMLDAHVGQAIDLGAKISEMDRSHVTEVCLASLRLKTGALMALALGAGAVVASASEETLDDVLKIGADIGVSLQMFDDLGNFQLNPQNPKRFEDLYLNRPSWAWAAVAQNSTDSEYVDFLKCVNELPREEHLTHWLHTSQSLPKARQQAEIFSAAVMNRFENQFTSPSSASPHTFPTTTPEKGESSEGGANSNADHRTMALHIVQNLLERIQISYG